MPNGAVAQVGFFFPLKRTATTRFPDVRNSAIPLYRRTISGQKTKENLKFLKKKMRRKTRALKFKPRNSIPPSNPSLISLHRRHQDHGASEDTGSSQDKGNSNNDVDADNVVVPDSVEMEDRRASGNQVAGPSGDCIVVDWLEGEFCIRCNSRSGQLLVCSENGCPVAIHKVCMNCEPKFDDTGKFYCPYCWYKRELARTKELRRKAMLAKKELSNFICLRNDGGNEEKREGETVKMKEASLSTMAGKVNSGNCENGLNDDDDDDIETIPHNQDCENGLNDDDTETIHHNQDERQGVESISKEKSDEESISRGHGFDNVGNGEKIQEEVIENSSGSEDDEIDEDQWQVQPSSSSHLGIVEGTLHVSTKETSGFVGQSEENLEKRGKEEPVLPNEVGTTMALISIGATSKVPAIQCPEVVSPDLDTETFVVRQKRFKRIAQKARRPQKVSSPKNPSFQPSNSTRDTKMNQEGGAKVAKSSVQCQESTERLMIPIVGTEKRRRLHWKAEEEDMLKDGVRIFSTEVNKNIPWRKILEFGHNVFHATRTPVDLKDKWKNIMAKEALKSNRGY
ncbi:uncharacterized protein LOC111314483 isoform X2 [Durio zibethinus]|uniref:Uncharacterized protein LOC111314483 isoform X2 n=1 Tax=Durio zibethinus TaxID=66656 RepID=A0A6P6B3K0_DURZI|nr:uncharacterized protein LOC111314483 isoform X2 [Durio zibethinus]